MFIMTRTFNIWQVKPLTIHHDKQDVIDQLNHSEYLKCADDAIVLILFPTDWNPIFIHRL